MRRDQGAYDHALQVLLQRGQIVPPAPDVVRARAVARARATVVAAMASAAAASVPTRGRGLRMALAASLALLIGAASATAAFRGWMPQPRDPSPQSRPGPRIHRPTPASAPAHPAPRVVASEATPTVEPPRPARQATPQESYAAELDLLQQAQAAHTRREFSGALMLVAEHGRRFPNGRLAEQREALRVRSLAGAGRADEARRAVAAFALRFPRSVLLQRLQETASPPDLTRRFR